MNAVGQPSLLRRLRIRRSDLEWMARAFCAGWKQFTDMAVPDQIAVCQSGCPVMAECGLFGVEGPFINVPARQFGIVFGGMRPETLKRLQAQRRAQVAS